MTFLAKKGDKRAVLVADCHYHAGGLERWYGSDGELYFVRAPGYLEPDILAGDLRVIEAETDHTEAAFPIWRVVPAASGE